MKLSLYKTGLFKDGVHVVDVRHGATRIVSVAPLFAACQRPRH